MRLAGRLTKNLQEDRWSKASTFVSKVKQPLDLKTSLAGGTYAVDAYYSVPALSIKYIKRKHCPVGWIRLPIHN